MRVVSMYVVVLCDVYMKYVVPAHGGKKRRPCAFCHFQNKKNIVKKVVRTKRNQPKSNGRKTAYTAFQVSAARFGIIMVVCGDGGAKSTACNNPDQPHKGGARVGPRDQRGRV